VCLVETRDRALTTNQTANFKDEDAQEEDVLYWEVPYLYAFPHTDCVAAKGEKHGRAISTHILEAVEVIGDGWDGGGDDGLTGVRAPINKHFGLYAPYPATRGRC
jgi:hypothetical protein